VTDRLAGGWSPAGRIVMTQQRPPNYYPFSVPLIMLFTFNDLVKEKNWLFEFTPKPNIGKSDKLKISSENLCQEEVATKLKNENLS
jgi:hypothetical protein